MVVSRNRVSCGGIFRKTTFEMEDLPLLSSCESAVVASLGFLHCYRLGPIRSSLGLWCPAEPTLTRSGLVAIAVVSMGPEIYFGPEIMLSSLQDSDRS